jgi:hypothetical protein
MSDTIAVVLILLIFGIEVLLHGMFGHPPRLIMEIDPTASAEDWREHLFRDWERMQQEYWEERWRTE